MVNEDLVREFDEKLSKREINLNFHTVYEAKPNFSDYIVKNRDTLIKLIGRNVDNSYIERSILYQTYELFDSKWEGLVADWIGIPQEVLNRVEGKTSLLDIFINYNGCLNLDVYIARHNLRKEKKSVKRKREIIGFRHRKRAIRPPREF